MMYARRTRELVGEHEQNRGDRKEAYDVMDRDVTKVVKSERRYVLPARLDTIFAHTDPSARYYCRRRRHLLR